MYTAALSAGVSGGVIISGLITIHLSWRYIYHVAAAIVGALLILVFFTFPETAFNRSPVDTMWTNEVRSEACQIRDDTKESPILEKGVSCQRLEMARNSATHPVNNDTDDGSTVIPQKESLTQRFAIFHGRFVNESYWKMFYRPIVLLSLPPVLWATLVMSVTIGFLVAISSNFASAFSMTYGFASWQSGLCFISGFVGTILGIFFGGTISDYVADFFTKRNGGIREPEMRLPAMSIGLICSPLGLILYGVGIDNNAPWIMPTLGLGLCKCSYEVLTNFQFR